MAEVVATLAELARSPRPSAEIGGKAANLARLVAAGVPVPEAIVLATTPGRTPADAARLLAALAAPLLAPLGPSLAVRSSAAVEDALAGSAAGLFTSRIGVAPEDLEEAIAEVLGSATSPAVTAYLGRLGHATPVAMAVIVQRVVRGRAAGVIYTRSPDPAHLGAALVEIERDDLVQHAVVAADGAVLDAAPDLALDATDLAALLALSRRAERAIAATGADIEWVRAEHGLVLVQARPITRATCAAPTLAPELVALSQMTPGVTWTLDIDHNPDPLSPAQIGLVERVAKISPYPMRVVAGHLYYGHAAVAPDDAPPPSAESLAALFADVVVPGIDRALAPIESSMPSLGAALAAYDDVFRIYSGCLGPELSRARASLSELDDTQAAASELHRALERCAAGAMPRTELAALAAPLAAAWDVAAPTYGEAPALLDRALERVSARARAGSTPHAIASSPAPGSSAHARLRRVVADIGETDDRLMFRAQTVVRSALLRVARAHGLEPADDVFYLPLGDLVGAEQRHEPLDRRAARASAAAARRRREAQRSLPMPLAVRDGRSLAPQLRWRGPGVWRGRGVGGVARGRVVRADDLNHLDLGPDAAVRGVVVVARTVTPPMVALVAGAVAMVSERGGVLGHAATIARELGIACVVGCGAAWSELRDGDEVLVDGERGLVVRLRDM